MIDKLVDITSLVETKIPTKKKKKPGKKSRDTTPELAVQEILKKLGIKYTTQYELGGKFYDIYIPSKNMLIEVDGNYCHGKDIEYVDKSKMQKRSFKNDLKKDGIATSHGFVLKRIWESEITLDAVKKLIYE